MLDGLVRGLPGAARDEVERAAPLPRLEREHHGADAGRAGERGPPLVVVGLLEQALGRCDLDRPGVAGGPVLGQVQGELPPGATSTTRPESASVSTISIARKPSKGRSGNDDSATRRV